MPRRTPRSDCAGAGRILLLCLAAGGAGLWGQQEDEGPQQKNTAHVNVYSERDLLVTRASSLVAQGRYAEALAIYDEALEKHPDALIPVDRARAIGVREYVLEQIAGWPEEGRALHRRRIDPVAELLFNSAKRAQDVEGLERLIDLYPFSSYVAPALALIANLWLDTNESERAAGALARLLTLEGDAQRPVTLARLGLAYARCGQKALLEDLLIRVRREVPGATVQAGGKDVPLLEYLGGLEALTSEGKRAAPPLEIPSWETLAGGSSGSRLAESGVTLTRLAWSDPVGLPRFDADDEGPGFRRGLLHAPTAEYRPLFPAVADGILYIQNGVALSAYNLFGRQTERLWQFRLPPPAGEVMFDNRVINCVSVHDGRVYANLIAAAGSAEDQLGYVRVKFPFPKRALVALDAYTGKFLWKLGGRPKTETLEENATFSTAPTPDGDRLYVGAVRQTYATDPFEHYVLCLDPASGRILWSTFVASGGTEINLFGNSTRESLGSPVSVTDDGVFYVTNHGVIAGLEKRSGRLRWTYRYRQLPVNPTRSVYVQKNRLEWVNSPPVVSGGVLAATPTDSSTLYALDARTGQVRWERPRQDVRTLYGVRDTTLVLGGERLELIDLRTGQSTSVPSNQLGAAGRGVVAEDGIYVPCRDRLRRVSWEGTWDESSSRAWTTGPGDGGNLLVVDGTIVLSTQDSVHVYFDRRDQEAAIRAEIARDPGNPSVLYRGALRFIQSGAPGEAAELLRRVIVLSARSSSLEDRRLGTAARKRLYAVSMEAGRLEFEGRRYEAARDRYLQAREAAPETASQVEASIELGRVYLAKGEDAGAVEEYQKLLSEWGDEVLGGSRVFDIARNAIDAIIRTVGRESYQKQEAAARELLAKAHREATPGAFLHVSQIYPNSVCAEDALLGAARAYARLGRLEEEIAVLRQVLRDYPASERSPETHAELVRALEEKGLFTSAGALLRRMARLFPDAWVKDAEGRQTVRDFAEGRLKKEAYARSSALDPVSSLAPPLRPVLDYTQKKYRDGMPLKIWGTPPASVANLLFMNYGIAVTALDLERKQEAWSLAFPTGVLAAAFVDEALVLADEESAVRVNPRDGNREWKYAAPTRMRGMAAEGPFLFFQAPDPRNSSAMIVGALDAVRGSVAWTQSFEGLPSSRVYTAGESVAFTTEAPSRIQLFDAETGRRQNVESSVAPHVSAQVVRVSGDLFLLQVERRFLEAYELPAGTLRWRVGLERSSLRAHDLGPSGLVLLGTQRSGLGEEERAFLSVVHRRTGKILRIKEGLEAHDPRFMAVEENRAYVVSVESDSGVGVRAYRLSDLELEWTALLGARDATLLAPSLAKNHLIVAMFEGSTDNKYGYKAALLDKTGRLVQNIESGFRFERPPGYVVAHNRLIWSVDNKVEVLR